MNDYVLHEAKEISLVSPKQENWFNDCGGSFIMPQGESLEKDIERRNFKFHSSRNLEAYYQTATEKHHKLAFWSMIDYHFGVVF